MSAARWLLIGATLTGCIYTPKPSIPVVGDNRDDTHDASIASTDSPALADRGITSTDTGYLQPDGAPSFDASGASDAPVVVPTDAGVVFDAPDFPDVDGSIDAGMSDAGTCDAGDDGGCDASADLSDADLSDADAGVAARP